MNLFDLIGNLVISAYNALGGALKRGVAVLLDGTSYVSLVHQRKRWSPEKLMALNLKLVNVAANLFQGRRPPPRIVEDQPRKVANRTSQKLDLDTRSAAAYRNRFPSDQAGAQTQHPSANALRGQQVRDGRVLSPTEKEIKKVILDLQELKKLLENDNYRK